jgi:lipid-A-disaccharide synthase
MPDPLRLFVLAGEPSGDRIGADLVERLRRKGELSLTGVGGPALMEQGLRPLFPMEELAVMGWADVLPRLPKLLWRARQVAQAIIRNRPDAVVLVDAQVFSRVVAQRVRRAATDIPMLLYVAPAVWAWKPQRAAALRPLFDEVLSVLPFEPKVMADLGGPPTSYVGHPGLARIRLRETQPTRGPLLLLPGSREGELRRHLPVMRDVAQRFAGHAAVDGFVLPTPRSMKARVAAEVAGWPIPARVVATEEDKLAAFRHAIAAVAVTGTVTLELALAGVPMVTTYMGDRGQYRRYLKYRVRHVALPNAILDRKLVPEVLGLGPEVDQLARELETLLASGAAEQIAGFRELRALMEDGAPEAPRMDPADRVRARLKR